MKQLLQILSSLIIIGSSSNVLVANSQIIKSTPKTNANLISINSQENLEDQDLILSNLSKDGGIVGYEASQVEIDKFSNLVPYYQFFTKLWGDKSIGYTTGPKNHQGLCEYVSLSTLLLYNELFISSGFFTDEEFATYFENNQQVSDNQIAMPEHKYYQYNQPENSLVRKLWKKNKSAKDIKTGKTLARAYKNWLSNKSISSKIKYHYSSSFMHSSSPEDLLLKYNMPVLVSFVKPAPHNVLIYGYDTTTKSYLVNYGWGGYSPIIIKKSIIWSYWSMGFWNAFYLDPANAQPLKRHFLYNNQFYSWKELEQKSLSFKNVPGLYDKYTF